MKPSRLPSAPVLLATAALALVAACGTQGAGFDRASSPPASEASAGALDVPSASDLARALGGALPSAEEELWIVARPRALAQGEPDELGGGELRARRAGAEVPVPLEHTEVRAQITAFIASVDVTQRFANPFAETIEAVYRFPLPENAAVHGFVMTIGERTIRGVIREREEAEELYLAARHQGFAASLVHQERANVFTQAVANIDPGHSIEVALSYLHTLAWRDGAFELRFPMVVAPRYQPRGAPLDRSVELAHLAPTERSGHDVSLTVVLEAGLAPRDVRSPSHAISVQDGGAFGVEVKLREHDSIPNRDFVLRWALGGAGLRTALVTSERAGEGHLALLLVPPESLADLPRRALELVLVVDCSGSMQGEGLSVARLAVRRALAGLERDDTFRLIAFAEAPQTLSSAPLPASEANLTRARELLDGLTAGGGTEMMAAVREAFRGREDPRRARMLVLFSDGLVGNEAELLSEVGARLGAARVFAFGIGAASNHYLVERMALLGRGAVGYLAAGEDVGAAMDAFVARIARPALADVAIDWGGREVLDVYPRRMPDLWAGRPVVVTARYRGTGGPIAVEGWLGERRERLGLDARLDASRHPGVALVWARRKLADLCDRALVEGPGALAEVEPEVRRVALEHGLLSAFTSFVAVDSLTRSDRGSGVSVGVPVPLPEGVRYEATGGER